MTVAALRKRRPEALADLLATYGRELQAVAYLILRDRAASEDDGAGLRVRAGSVSCRNRGCGSVVGRRGEHRAPRVKRTNNGALPAHRRFPARRRRDADG